MFRVNDSVRIIKDVDFDYGTVVKRGCIDTICKIDNEGFWLKDIDIYIQHGFEDEYLELIK